MSPAAAVAGPVFVMPRSPSSCSVVFAVSLLFDRSVSVVDVSDVGGVHDRARRRVARRHLERRRDHARLSRRHRAERARERRRAVARVADEHEARRRRIGHVDVQRIRRPVVRHRDRVDDLIAGNHRRRRGLRDRHIRHRHDRRRLRRRCRSTAPDRSSSTSRSRCSPSDSASAARSASARSSRSSRCAPTPRLPIVQETLVVPVHEPPRADRARHERHARRQRVVHRHAGRRGQVRCW